GLVDGVLQALALAHKFATHIDIAHMRAHGAASDQAALDQQMRIVTHDLAVLAGAGLGLVGVHDEIARPPVRLLGHEGPFQAGGKSGATAAAQAGSLHLVDNPVAALVEDVLGAVPGAAGARSLELPVVKPVKILEDAILVCEHRYCPLLSPIGGWGTAASRTSAALPGFFALLSLNAGPAATPLPFVE